MLAVQSVGAIPVPLYQDAVAAEIVFPIGNAEVRFAIVEDQEQVDKLLEVRVRCPALERISYDDPRGLRNLRERGVESIDASIESGVAGDRSDPVRFDAAVAEGRGGVSYKRRERWLS
jgi:long-chain acyl-CoA synthetase